MKLTMQEGTDYLALQPDSGLVRGMGFAVVPWKLEKNGQVMPKLHTVLTTIEDQAASAMPEIAITAPLVLDLDGTLVRSDLLLESFTVALKRNPGMAFICLWWLVARGISHLKNQLAKIAVPDIDVIPVNTKVLAFAEAEAAAGRSVVLATAADSILATRIARRFAFISRLISSDGITNLKGSRKAASLSKLYPQGFIYAGDSAADLPVWRAASAAVTVETSARVSARVKSLGIPVHAIHREKPQWRVFVKAIRLQQWVKNTLVFAPVALAGLYADPLSWGRAGMAFTAIGLIASATYLLNDLSDIADDRRHWSKRNRPLAAGTMPITTALVTMPVFLGAGIACAAALGIGVLAVTLVYGATTLSYSLWLKRVPILDTVMLAGMFSIRLLLGVVAIGAVISPWLFVFSMALFLSISLAKRHTEVLGMQKEGILETAGRGYRAVDQPFILALGASAAVSAIAFLSLYLMDDTMRSSVYASPQFLWIAPVAILLWIGRIWLLSQRGELDDDPVAFAVRDRLSLMLGLSVTLAFALAVTVKLPPWIA